MRRLPLTLALALAACAPDGGDGARTLAAPDPLPSPAAAGSAEPNLVVAPDGAVLLSWIEPAPDSTHALRFARLDGDAWSAPRTVAAGDGWFVNWADFPAMIALPGGRLAAHWLQRSTEAERGYDYEIRVVQSADGGETWRASVVPHRDGALAEHGFLSFFPAGGDSIGMVWLDGRRYTPAFGDTDEMTLHASTLAADGSLGPEVEVDARICDCCQTDVALAASGPVAVYRDRTADEVRDIYLARQVDGRWTTGQPVHQDGWRIDACPVNGPAVAAEGERVAVAWFTAARDTPRVQVAFSEDGGATFGAPRRVDGGDPVGRVDVTLLADGAALVSWVERGAGEGAEVRARLVGAVGRMGEPTLVAASDAARASGFPRMARAGDRVVFAWTEPGEPARVRTAILSVAGRR